MLKKYVSQLCYAYSSQQPKGQQPRGHQLEGHQPIKRTVHGLFFVNSTFNRESTKNYKTASNLQCTVRLIGMFGIFPNSTLNRTVRLIGCMKYEGLAQGTRSSFL